MLARAIRFRRADASVAGDRDHGRATQTLYNLAHDATAAAIVLALGLVTHRARRTTPPTAEARAVAREHYEKAVNHFNAGEYVAAADEFLGDAQSGAAAGALVQRGAGVSSRRRRDQGARALPHVSCTTRRKPSSAPTSSGASRSSRARPSSSRRVPDMSVPDKLVMPAKTGADDATGGPAAAIACKPIAEVVKQNRAGFRACFDKWSKTHPGVNGRVTLTFYLDPDGNLDQPTADEKGFASPEVATLHRGALAHVALSEIAERQVHALLLSVRLQGGTLMANPMIANKYELVAPLGEGGMASVYRGAHARRGRLHLQGGDQARLAQSRRGRRVRRHVRRGGARRLVAAASEHRAGARLRSRRRGALLHRHGVDRRHRSRRLDRLVRRATPTPWHEVAAIGVEILRGLGAAHERVDGDGKPAPVIHRDVSPQNVLLSVQGIVKLADFGLARAADRATMTAPGTIKGKLGYLAPELVKRAPASPKSDLYAVGIVLWEALIGQAALRRHRRLRPDQEDPAPTRCRRCAKRAPMCRCRWRKSSTRRCRSIPADRFERAEEMQRALASTYQEPHRADGRSRAWPIDPRRHREAFS